MTVGDMPGMGSGADLGGGFAEAEIDDPMGQDGALSAEHILWRRSKLGLHVSRDTEARLDDWLERKDAVTGRALTR